MNLLKFIIPRKYRILPPGSYEATIDKVIFHRNGTVSLRIGNVVKAKEVIKLST